MNDSSSPAADELPELSTDTGTAPGNRRRVRALWGALAAIAVGVGAIAVQASDDDPPRLPLALGAEGGGTREAAADMSMRAFVHYTAGDDLPELGDGGPAYRLSGDPDEAAVRALAAAFGLDDDLEQDDRVWRATDGTHSLEVYPGLGAGWWYGPTDATKSSVDIGSDVACPEPADASMLPPECAPDVTTTSTISPDLPSKDEATAIALDVLEQAGVDTDGATVTVDGPYDGWYVTVEPELDGRPTGLYSSVTVGDDGEVLFASGMLADATKLGDYDTVDTTEAIDRLNEGFGGFAGAGYGGPAEAVRDIATADPTTEFGTVEECTESSDGATSCATVPACPDVVDGDASTTVPNAATPVERYGCVDGLPIAPQELIEVVLHDAEPILVLVGATDGSDDGYLVPGYRFTGDDEAVVDQVAIADDALAPVGAPYPGAPSDDGPTEPATDPAGPSSIEPSSGGGASSSPGAAGAGTSGYDPNGSVSSPVQPDPGQVTPPAGPTTPCTLPKPGPNGEVPLIGCAEPAAG